MSAYWVNEYRSISDPDKVSAYAAIATEAIAEAGGEFIARGMPEKVYEAGEETRTVIVRFPTLEAALAAYDSPRYQEALAALGDGAVRDLRIVPGVD